MNAAEYQSLINLVESRCAEWPPLDPLPEMAEEVPAAFPFDAMGCTLGTAAAAIAEHVQAPDALAAGSVLAAASVAAQPHADVVMPHGQRTPLSLFVVTSALSGDRKSATDDLASQPLERVRREDARQHAAELRSLRDSGERHELPKARSLIVSKGTPEGLHDRLKGQPHIGLFSPEGAEVLSGSGLQKERRPAGVAWLLKAWGGSTLDEVTRTSGLSVLVCRRLALHVLVQPVILRELMTDPFAQGQGLVARCLIAEPRTLAGKRLFKDMAPIEQNNAVRGYWDRLDLLLNRRPPVNPRGDGYELQPRALTMTPEARALWIEAYDEVERRQADGADLAGVRPWASKFAEQTARIAGIQALAGDPDASVIDTTEMAGALVVAGYYLSEHVRLMGQSVVRLQLSRLHALLRWLREKAPRLRHVDVLQLVPRDIRALKADGINRLLGELAERGYVRRHLDQWEIRP